MMFDKILPSRHTAAEVSSQDDSMARMVQWVDRLLDNGKILNQWTAKVGFPAISEMLQPAD
jgi:folate-dependent phosphoribosylglycinamide formyltransferase PurN